MRCVSDTVRGDTISSNASQKHTARKVAPFRVVCFKRGGGGRLARDIRYHETSCGCGEAANKLMPTWHYFSQRERVDIEV